VAHVTIYDVKKMEDKGCAFLRNVGRFEPEYMASQPKKAIFKSLLP
jgi:hypothetical protein